MDHSDTEKSFTAQEENIPAPALNEVVIKRSRDEFGEEPVGVGVGVGVRVVVEVGVGVGVGVGVVVEVGVGVGLGVGVVVEVGVGVGVGVVVEVGVGVVVEVGVGVGVGVVVEVGVGVVVEVGVGVVVEVGVGVVVEVGVGVGVVVEVGVGVVVEVGVGVVVEVGVGVGVGVGVVVEVGVGVGVVVEVGVGVGVVVEVGVGVVVEVGRLKGSNSRSHPCNHAGTPGVSESGVRVRVRVRVGVGLGVGVVVVVGFGVGVVVVVEKMTTTQLFINQPWNNDFNCEKNDRIQEIAVRELKEDERKREQCLSQLREWIKQNKDIENCITDYLEPKVNTLLTNGYIFASPYKDKHGRRVVITDSNKFDTNCYNSTDQARAHAIAYETLIEDEDNQIAGVTHVCDAAVAFPSMITIWSINEFATLVTWGDQSFPMRHKEINIFNMPSMFKYVYDFAASRVSQKLRDRAKMYESMEQMHTIVDSMVLPSEYGGVMPTSEMIDLWKQELAAKRDRLLSYDKINLLSDEGIIRRRTKIDENNLSGSFRKLEFD
ncbi:hypothetical protein FQR65_LT07909 [Abscondita terminalis]|nr:hypothetical protein FQR65_LT07909 [Abscondita terminalis]